MIHDPIKYLVQTLFRPGDLLEICYFYISQTRSNLDEIFYKVMYRHIIFTFNCLVNLDDFFTVVCMSFHKSCGFQ
jgi:hypothetical protein